jgi:hypothetical protein
MCTKLLSRLLLVLLLSSLAVGVHAQTVTYCDTYTGPPSGFSLTVPRFDRTSFPLMDADVLLDVTYNGQLVGENIHPTQWCAWAFGLNLRLGAQDFAGAVVALNKQVEAEGELGPAGGADPYTVTVPFTGTIAQDAVLGWSNLAGFYADQVLPFTASGLGGVFQMMGQGVFGWSFTITAQVCVTYTYDGAIGTTATSFGALKATYR